MGTADDAKRFAQDAGDAVGEQARLIGDRANAYAERYDIHYTPERAAHRSKKGDIFLFILAIFLPPVSVFLKAGCGCELLANIILWALCWIPGVVHAFYIIAAYP